MEIRTKILLIASAAICLCLMAGAFVLGWKIGKGRKEVIETVKVETKIDRIRDTVTVFQPQFITRTEIRRELVPITDTLRIRDTVYAALPIERKEYRDSNYRAVISGIRPELESITIHPETRIITQTVTKTITGKPARFGVGVQLGFGACYGLQSKQMDAGPYIGIGLSYNFLRF